MWRKIYMEVTNKMKGFCLRATLLTLLVVIAFAFSGLEAVWAQIEITSSALVRARLRLDNDKVADTTAKNSYNIYRYAFNVKVPLSDNATLGCQLAPESPLNFISMGKGTDNLPEVTFQQAYLKWNIKDKVTFTGGRFPYHVGYMSDLHFNPDLAVLGPVDFYFLVFHAATLEGCMLSAPLVKGDTKVSAELAISPAVERPGAVGDKTEHDTYDCILATPIGAMEGKLNLRPSVAVRTTADDKDLKAIGNVRLTAGVDGKFAVNEQVSAMFGVGYSMVNTDNVENNVIGFSIGPAIKGVGPGVLKVGFDMAILNNTKTAVKTTTPFTRLCYEIPFKDKVTLQLLHRMYMRKTDDDKKDWMRNQFDITLKANHMWCP